MHYISEVMGHHSIDFIRRHYARLFPDSANRAFLRVLEERGAGRPIAEGNWHQDGTKG